MKKVVLVTGVTGFLGSHLLKKLIEDRNNEIICLKRSFSSLEKIKKIKDEERIKFYDIDTIDKLETIFLDNKIDVVVHLATEYGREDKNISKVLEANLMFPIKILELATLFNVKCFINTDSYFNKENLSYKALINYSISKKSFLSWLKIFSSKIKVINVILEHMYGEEDSESKFVQYIFRKLMKNEYEIDLTHGHQRRDFIYIDDVVSAYEKIITFSINHNFTFKEFEVGTGESYELKEIVELIKKESNSKTKLNFGKIKYRSDEIMESKANTQELKELGWAPIYNLEKGVKKIVRYYKEKEGRE